MRIAEIHITVKVFAVGGLIEDKIASDLRSSYEAAIPFIHSYAKEKGY